MADTAPPREFAPGDYVTWEVSNSDYPATDGWQLRYAFMSDDEQVLVPSECGTVTDAGNGAWTVVLTTDETSTYFTNLGTDNLLGTYRWQEYVQIEPGPTQRKSLRWGILFLRRNLDSGALSAGLDIRGHVKTVLDAIRAVIAGKATKDQSSYSIAGRALARYSWDELVRMEAYYAGQWERELAFERFQRGQESPAIVRGRFPSAGTY